MTAEPDVTVVLTCLDECDIVVEAIEAVRSALALTAWRPIFIVVDDGSSEETVGRLERLAETDPAVRLIVHGANFGRGRSVADGFAKATTRFAGFIDPDLEIPAVSIIGLLGALEAGADVAVGRRVHPYGFRHPVRHLLSRGFAVLTQATLSPPVPDTQAGCKFFTREALERLLPEVVSQGWFWDTEAVIRAARHGMSVRDVPVAYFPRPGRRSKVELVSTVQSHLRGVRILMSS